MSEENDEVIREQVAGESAGAGVAAADVVCYKRGALVTGAIEESRLLNLDLENLYPGSYTVPVSQADGEIVEVSFVRVLPGAVKAEFRAAELSEVVRVCGRLGELVRIPARQESGASGKVAGASAGAIKEVNGGEPYCFGDFPSMFPHLRAERCCDDCSFGTRCLSQVTRREVDDDDPLWCVNARFDDLLMGFGASEDHQGVVNFLVKSGLSNSIAERVHGAILCAEAVPPSVVNGKGVMEQDDGSAMEVGDVGSGAESENSNN